MISIIKKFFVRTASIRNFSEYGYLTKEKWFSKYDLKTSPKNLFDKDIPKQDESIVVSSKQEYTAYEKFAEIPDLDNRLLSSLDYYGYKYMAPIQSHSFDILNEGKCDLLGSAETGSGKTLAYLLPYLNSIMKNYPEENMSFIDAEKTASPLLLVISPTRELTQQINFEASKLLRHTYLKSNSVIGGESKFIQLSNLKKYGCHVLSATPGRLIDFMKMEVLSLKYTYKVVLDEADRMLDMGFKDDVNYILSSIGNKNFDMSLFSATFNRDIMHLVQNILKPNYAKILIGDDAGKSKAVIPKGINHSFIDGTDSNSLSELKEILKDKKKTIIFTNSKSTAKFLSSKLTNARIPVLSSDSKQIDRTQILNGFRMNKFNVIIGTDLLSRGIDISDVERIINYGIPVSIDSYIHRAGRCGRMGRSGECITVINSDFVSRNVLNDIKSLLKSLGYDLPRYAFNNSTTDRSMSKNYTFQRQSNYQRQHQYSENETNNMRFLKKTFH